MKCPYCEKASIDGLTHAKCRRKFGLDGQLSVWNYEGVIRKAILALKYKFAHEIVSELSGLVVAFLKSRDTCYLLPATSAFVPIPLHWHRQNFRGFNQSEEIGRALARKMGWKFIPYLLVKRKQTISQTELKGKERHKNLKGVFTPNPCYSSSIIHNSFVLFDDVWTTGSTLKEAAKVLKRAGAKRVWGLTLSRTF